MKRFTVRDPIAWAINWGFVTAFSVAFATMCLMAIWQGA